MPPQSSEPAASGFLLRAPARAELSRFQSDWLDWLTACNEDDREGAAEAVARLVARARLLGMSELPGLSVGAATQAIEFAAAGAGERARWAVEAAEQLAPGRPETAFAEARLARAEGRRFAAVAAAARGLFRVAGLGMERSVLAYDAGWFVVALLVLVSLGWVAVQMVVKGPWLYRDLLTVAIRVASVGISHALAIVALLWPLLMPSGLLWLAFYWSLLLWIYCGRRERLLFVAAWVLMALAPSLLVEQGRRLERSLMPTVAGIETAAAGGLEGGLYWHLGELEARLPESVAVRHLLADAHRKVGQCDLARQYYERVLAAEPENVAARVDLGACHFEAGDFQGAINLFREAAAGREPDAAVQFNLSRAYSELYRFEQSEAALRTAQELDPGAVSRWMRVRDAHRVVSKDGGLERVDEIGPELERLGGGGSRLDTGEGIGRRMLPLPPLAVLLAVAVALQLAVTALGSRSRSTSGWWKGDADRWRRVLVPGLREAEEGDTRGALLALAALMALLALPVSASLGLGLPLVLHPGFRFIVVAVAALAVAMLAARALREWRR